MESGCYNGLHKEVYREVFWFIMERSGYFMAAVQGSWSISGTTAIFKVSGLTALMVTGLDKTKLANAYNEAKGTITGLEVTELADADTETVGQVSIANDVLGTSNVAVKGASSDLTYEFTLGNGVNLEEEEKDVWVVSGTTATYKSVIQTYYEVNEDDPSKIICHKQTDAKGDDGKSLIYATVKGLAKGIYVADDGTVCSKTLPNAEDDSNYDSLTAAEKKVAVDRGEVLTIADNVISLNKFALGTSTINVTDGNSGKSYTLAFNKEGIEESNTDLYNTEDNKIGLVEKELEWEVKGTTATYQYDTSAGWEIESTGTDAGKKITYTKANTTVVATIKGLAKNLTVDDFTGAEAVDDDESTTDVDETKAAVKKGANVTEPEGNNKGVITLSKKLLGTTKVSITSDEYKLGVDTENTDYELKVETSTKEADVWSISGTTATYKKVKTDYYTLKEDGSEITYTKEEAVKSGNKAIVYATISGVNKDLAVAVDEEGKYKLVSKDESGNAIDAIKVTKDYVPEEKNNDGEVTTTEEIGVITIANGALNKANITLKDGNGKYTFVNAEDDNAITAATVTNGTWSFSKGTATYKGQVAEGGGYTFSADGKSINYTKATDTSKNANATQTLITISGLNKNLTETEFAALTNPITFDAGDPTIVNINSADLLGDANITIKEKGYKLADIEDAESGQTVIPTKVEGEIPEAIDVWRISGTTASFKSVIPAYYTFDAAKNSYIYVKEKDKLTYAQVTGLAKKDANNKDIEYSIDDATGQLQYKIGTADAANVFDLISVKAYDEAGEEIVEVTEDSDVDHYGGTIAFASTAVIDKAVKLDTKKYKGFALDLGSDSKADNVVSIKEGTTPTWSIKGTTATLTGDTGDGGFTVTDNSITKVAGSTTAVLATIKNLNLSNYTVTEDGLKIIPKDTAEDAIGSTDSVITATAGTGGEAGTISISKDILNKKNVTLEGVGNYKLTQPDGTGVTESTTETPAFYWVVTNGKAEYYQGTNPGYELSSDGKTIAYQAASTKTDKLLLFTITGLAKDLKANDLGQISEITESDGTFTIGKSILNGENVKLTKASGVTTEYKIEVFEDLAAKADQEIWTVTGTTAVLKAGTTAGYAANQAGTEITYSPANTGSNGAIVELKGLKSGLKVNADGSIDGISIEDGTITLDNRVLGTSTVTVTKGNDSELEEGTDYELALDTDENSEYAVDETKKGDSYWDVPKAGSAVFTEEIGAGYKVEDNKVVYVRAQTVKTTLNNLNVKTSDLKNNAISGISIVATEGGASAIQIDEKFLNEKAVSINKNSEYTLAVDWFDRGSASSVITDPIWVKTNKETKAVYQQTVSKGYSLSDDAKTINYSNKETTKTLATITGLAKDIIAGADSSATDSYGKLGIIGGDSAFVEKATVTAAEVDATDTRGSIALAEDLIKMSSGDIKLGNKDNYKFDLMSVANLGASSIEEHFIYNNGNATLATGTTAGWSIVQTAGADTPEDDTDDVYEDRVIKYTKATTGAAKITLKGLAKGLDVVEADAENPGTLYANINGTSTAILTLGESGAITVYKDALGTTDIVLDGTEKSKYALDLGEGIASESLSAAYAWRVNNTTATYKQINPAWYEDKNSSIVAHAETDVKNATVATITGLKKGVTIGSGEDDEGKLGIYVVDSDSGTTEFVAAYGDGGFTEYEELAWADSDGTPVVGTLGDSDEDGELDKGTLALDEAVLGEGTIALKSDLYKLSLGEASAPEAYGATWKKSGANAVLEGGVSAGWIEKGDGKTINYVKGSTKTTLATVTNISKIDGMQGGESVITVTSANLNEKNATLKDSFGLGYTIQFTGSSASSTVSSPEWKVSGTKATYVESIGAGYSQDGDYNIKYLSKATTQTLATINGLNKNFTGSESAIEALSAATAAATGEETIGTITLEKDWLNQGAVTLGKNDKFQFSLGEGGYSAFAASVAEDPWWNYKNGTVSFVEGTTEGWSFKENKDGTRDYKNLVYTAEKTSTLANITGLVKNATIIRDDEDTTNLGLVIGSGSDTVQFDDPAITFTGTSSVASLGGTFSINYGDILDAKTGKVSVTGANASKFGLSIAGESMAPEPFGGENENPEKWYINGTTAYLKAGETEGWIHGDKTKNSGAKDNMQSLVFAKESLVADSLAAAKITGLAKGLVVGTADYALAAGFSSYESAEGLIGIYDSKNKVFTPGLTVNEGVITFISAGESSNSVALTTTSVSLSGASGSEYTFGEGGFIAAGLSDPTWNLDTKGVAHLKQKTTAGFTLNEEENVLTYVSASKDATNGDDILTISGLKKGAASTASINTALADAASNMGITATYEDGSFSSVIVLDNSVLNESKVTLSDKSKKFSLSLAENVALSEVEATEWVLSGTTATYKTYKRGYYTADSLGTSVSYKAGTKGVAYAAITGIDSNAALSTADDFDSSSKVFKLSDDMLASGKAVKISSGDAYTLDVTGITASSRASYANSTWDTKTNASGKVAITAASVSAGWELSEDGKTFNYVKASTKSTEVASITGLKTNKNVSFGDNKVVTLTSDIVNKKKITIKGNGYTLALGESLSGGYSIKETKRLVNDDDEEKTLGKYLDWSLNKGKAVLSGEVTESYWLSDDKKSVGYTSATASGKSKALVTISGFKTSGAGVASTVTAEGAVSLSAAEVDAEAKVVSLTSAAALDSKVTVTGGEFSVEFADNYTGAITGSTAADTIKAKGVVSITAGKGNDVIDFDGGGGHTFIYASGDGDDTITGFAATDKISTKVAVTAENIRVGTNGTEVVIGKGAINLGEYDGEIIIVDKNSTTTYAKGDNGYAVKTDDTTSEEGEEGSEEGRSVLDEEISVAPIFESARLSEVVNPVAMSYAEEDFTQNPAELTKQSAIVYSGQK